MPIWPNIIFYFKNNINLRRKENKQFDHAKPRTKKNMA